MKELDTESKAKIGIAWWNTSLSPPGKRKTQAKEQDRVVASDVVKALVRGEGIDCLALGEVTAEDLQYLLKSCALTDYTAFDGTLRLGRLQFDVGVLYNRAVLDLADSKEITSEYGQQSLKVAQRLDLITKQTNEQLCLLSHIGRVEYGVMKILLRVMFLVCDYATL